MGETSRDVATHLPYLRRYARALTGSQTRGDEYVRACLEALLAEPQRIDGRGGLRRQLFALFHDIWRVVQATSSDQDAENPDLSHLDRMRKSLATMPPLERQVLLLVSLEGFSYEDTASILGLEVEETRRLLHKAQTDMQRRTAAPILVLEDEKIIALDIARIIEEMGHQLCGMAADRDEAVQLALQTQPALVLADVQLRGGDSGIDAVRDILARIEAPVVFVTGYPERLLTGSEVEPTFVVAKPFRPQTLKTAIAQALSVSRDAEEASR
jgi:DNA-directed RNA polymerase specialized sigma24 family protein/CheY-like chemotaxis protein